MPLLLRSNAGRIVNVVGPCMTYSTSKTPLRSQLGADILKVNGAAPGMSSQTSTNFAAYARLEYTPENWIMGRRRPFGDIIGRPETGQLFSRLVGHTKYANPAK